MNLQGLSLEQLQEIVDGAPEGATHYAANEAGLNYYKREPFRSSMWIDDYWQSLFNDFDVCSQRYINLADLRAELLHKQEFDLGLAPDEAYVKSDFAVGDRVVAIGGDCTEIFEIDRKGRDGSFWDTRWRMLNIEIFRHATPAEKAAGRRIDAPTVCVEQETPELFNSKHCSPRNYIQQYFNNMTDDEKHLKELDASVGHAKAVLATFNYKPITTDRELKQAEQIRILRTDRNVWCAMFFIAVVGYGVARWML